MKKAVIYSRVSTTVQDYTSQTAELVKEAERQGYEVTKVYEEKESGFVDDRPELAKVLTVTKADTDAVFVWEISRLSRRTVMVLSTVEETTCNNDKNHSSRNNSSEHNCSCTF